MANALRSMSLRSLPCATVNDSEPGPFHGREIVGRQGRQREAAAPRLDDDLLVIQANADQRIARQALADVHELARRHGDLARLGGIFQRDTAHQFDFQVGTGQRQLLPLYDEKNVGQHRQGLTALDDASNQLQGFNRASR